MNPHWRVAVCVRNVAYAPFVVMGEIILRDCPPTEVFKRSSNLSFSINTTKFTYWRDWFLMAAPIETPNDAWPSSVFLDVDEFQAIDKRHPIKALARGTVFKTPFVVPTIVEFPNDGPTAAPRFS